MRESERKLYEQEAEIRPNRYVALALTVLSGFIILMLLLNEVDVFLVAKERMRLGAFAALIVLEIPLFVSGTDAGLRNGRTKYIMIGCAAAATAILCTALNFHATLALLLPVLLAGQYPSLKMSRISILCSILCAFISPVVGYLTGLWDTAFIERLGMFVGRSMVQAAEAERMSLGTCVAQILLYISVPHALILIAFYPLSSSIAHSGEQRLKNSIQVLHMSESDALTGLLNRLSFERNVSRKVLPEDGNVAVIYIDANDLHRLNNDQGHSAGDRMLICIAENLRNAFGNECVYRIGGDEFVSIVYGLTLAEVKECTARVRANIEQHGYSVSEGIEYAQPPCTLQALIASAETKMMISKKRYHINR